MSKLSTELDRALNCIQFDLIKTEGLKLRLQSVVRAIILKSKEIKRNKAWI